LRSALKIAQLLLGYSVMGVGILLLMVVTKLLLDVFPEVLGAILVGTAFTSAGFWILNKKI